MIKLAFTGATRMELDAQGDLIVHTAHGELIEQAPQLYQNIDGAQRAVSGSFTIDRAGIVGLQVGDYDHTLPLVIDPVLGYSTYVGGSGDDFINGMAVDPKTGDTYVLGTRYPADYVTAGPIVADAPTAFLSKFNARGELQWSDILGDARHEFQYGVVGVYTNRDSFGGGIAVGPDGSVYVTYQTTEETWEVFAPPDDLGDNFWGWHTGDMANLVKIAPDDGTIIFDTTFSDTHDGANRQSGVFLTVGHSLAVDSEGAAYVPLAVDSPYGGATIGGFAIGGDPDFVVKLDADGTQQFMAEVPLFPSAIAVDAHRDFFIAGNTALDGLGTAGAFQPTKPAPDSSSSSPYIAEYDPTGQYVLGATYLGSPEGNNGVSHLELISAIALSPADPNLLYVAGETNSPNFPVQSYFTLPQLQPFQSTLNQGVLPAQGESADLDAFVAALDVRDMSLVSSTYLGGSGMDFATSLAVDRTGNVYVAGETAPHATLTFTMDGSPDALLLGPSDFPTVDPLMPAYTKGYALAEGHGAVFTGPAGGAATDIFVSKFDSSLESLEFSTYLGGSGHDVYPEIALDDSRTIHVAGTTAGFGTGVSQQSYTYTQGGATYTSYYYVATGTDDDFPTLHADQAQFGGGFLNVDGVANDGTDVLGYSGFGESPSSDLPVDGFLLAINQSGALKETLSRI